MAFNSFSDGYGRNRAKAGQIDIDMLDAELEAELAYQYNPNDQYGHGSAATFNRAKDLHGKPSQTVCFERAHLNHPHHHFLKCGHDIVTGGIERCGINCMTSYRVDSIPTGKEFECPHPNCVRQRAVLRQKTLGRHCQLSHVYGRDLNADEARREEKAKYEATSRIALGERIFKNKRSPSPEPSTTHDQERSTKRRKAQSKARVQQALTGIKLDRNVKALENLDFDDREKVGNHGEISFPDSDVRTETYDGYKCNCCEAKIEVVRHRCGVCEDQHKQEVDLCAKCYVYRNAQMWSRKPAHHLDDHKFMQINIGAYEARERLEEMRRGPEDQDKDFELLETYCTCESGSVEHMMECEKCGKPFHIGCAGEGSFEPHIYQTMEDVEMYHEDELQMFRNRHTDIPFLCIGCKSGGYDEAVAEQSRKQNLDDVAIIRRANARQQAAGGANGVRKNKRRADQSIDTDGPHMGELFGKEEFKDETEERPVKCAKTGHDVPTFGQWTVPMGRNK